MCNSSIGLLPWWSCSIMNSCYRCLGPPTFFLYSILSTIPLSMGHDNQWQRDLFGDLGSVCRWWCSKHHLLKAESIASLLSHFLFILDLFISLSAWLTHPSSFVIMLTLICHFHLLLQTLPPRPCSLYVQPHSPYLHYFILYSHWL